MNVIYHPNAVTPEIAALLQELAVEYPIRTSGEGLQLNFIAVSDPGVLRLRRQGDCMDIEYGKIAAAARGIGYALSGLEAEECLDFTSYGILYDCSRASILTVKHAGHWLRRLALMGYNMMMLYTKDAYQLPGENYFGYMRGAYSQEEIQAIDRVAQRLGIEMVASIQALGHLEPILRWPAYLHIKDTDNVIMVDNEDSYQLIEKMLRFWSEALDSRRIHIGMDETHDLGRGRFQDLHGKQNAFDLYNRHLKRVCEICNELQLRPMIWSDMYFRLGNKNMSYYDLDSIIPDEVKAAIAPEAQLVYWDYYHRDEAFYRKMLQLHRGLGQKPVAMASGIWTWLRLWYDHATTTATVRPCLKACRQEGVKEVIFALWGDDGGYCEFDSAFAGLAWAADEAFNGESNDERLETFFQGVFGSSYRRQLLASNLNFELTGSDLPAELRKRLGEPPWLLSAPAVLWDDPLMGIVWHEYRVYDENVWQNYAQSLRILLEKLNPYRCSDRQAGDIGHAWHCANALLLKVNFRLQLCEAYQQRQRCVLGQLASTGADAVIGAIDGLNDSFRRQWLRSYKYDGLEVMQIKLAGLRERYRETSRRITELLDGTIDAIPELDLTPQTIGLVDPRYRMIATGGWFI